MEEREDLYKLKRTMNYLQIISINLFNGAKSGGRKDEWSHLIGPVDCDYLLQ